MPAQAHSNLSETVEDINAIEQHRGRQQQSGGWVSSEESAGQFRDDPEIAREEAEELQAIGDSHRRQLQVVDGHG